MMEMNKTEVQQELFEPELFQRTGADRWKDYMHLKPLLSGIEPGQGVEESKGSGAAVLREIESWLRGSAAIVLNNAGILLKPGVGDPEGIAKDLYSLVRLTMILTSWQKVKMDELIEEGRKVSALAEAIRRRYMPRVLVVDDDSCIREVIPELIRLKFPKAEIRTAVTNGEALESLVGFAADLITTDCYHPGGNGIDLLRKLRSMPRFSRTPVVLISGRADDLCYPQPDGATFDAVFAKPLPAEEFMDTMTRLLDATCGFELRPGHENDC
jgi:two-component system, chemotaxis family, chemotaxis protein CheY